MDAEDARKQRENDLLERSRNAKDTDWVPYDQRPAESGLEAEWGKTDVVLTLTVPGLGKMRIRCAVNLKDPVGRLHPETESLASR